MPKIGPRLWKTGLAVALAVLVLRMAGARYEVFGALAAVLAVAPSADRSFKTAAEQIAINMLGGLIGTVAVVLFGPTPLVFGVVVVTVLLVCQALNWRSASGSAVTVTLFVMAPHPEAAFAYSGWRLLSVAVGSLVGALVNALLWPPDYWPATLEAIRRAGAELDSLVVDVAARLEQPGSFTKAEILSRAARVEAQLTEVRRLVALLGDGGGNVKREVLDRSLKVLGSLLERIQIVHKAALAAQRIDEFRQELPEIQEALQSVCQHRRRLYEAILMGTPTDPVLSTQLLALERTFEGAIRLPEQTEVAEAYFRLYRMRSSVSYMANRLGRLQVALEGSRPDQVAAAAEGSMA